MRLAFLFIIVWPGYVQSSVAQKQVDWLLIYYMPYDNDLTSMAKPIIQQFKNAEIGKNVTVTLQADFAGPGGIKRYQFTSKVDSTLLETENSASTNTFSHYLKWAADTYQAKYYAVILLSHGGKMNEYGVDEFPAHQWLPLDSLAASITQFNKQEGIHKLDLFFEQVCTRATLENLFEFKDVAKYTLASQTLVPAPGYYYKSLLEHLSVQPSRNGKELAESIVAREQNDMYYSLTLIDNSKWSNWEKLLDNYSKSIENSKSKKIHVESLQTLSYSFDFYWDFVSLVKSIKADSLNTDAIALLKFTETELIAKHFINPTNNLMVDFSGISIRMPFRDAEDNFAIWKNSSFNKFISALRSIRK